MCIASLYIHVSLDTNFRVLGSANTVLVPERKYAYSSIRKKRLMFSLYVKVTWK